MSNKISDDELSFSVIEAACRNMLRNAQAAREGLEKSKPGDAKDRRMALSPLSGTNASDSIAAIIGHVIQLHSR